MILVFVVFSCVVSFVMLVRMFVILDVVDKLVMIGFGVVVKVLCSVVRFGLLVVVLGIVIIFVLFLCYGRMFEWCLYGLISIVVFGVVLKRCISWLIFVVVLLLVKIIV